MHLQYSYVYYTFTSIKSILENSSWLLYFPLLNFLIAEAIENCDFKTLDGAVYPNH